jgi:hypothetical protein
LRYPTAKPRWLLILGLTAVIAMGFAACGDDGDDGDQNSGNNNSGATGSTGTTGDTAATGDTGTTPFTGATGTGGTVTAVDSTSNLDVASIRYFATSSPWNTSAQGLPVADDSARMLDLAVQRIAVREVPGKEGVVTFIRRRPEALTINTLAWAPLVVPAGGDGAEMTRMVCRQSDCGPEDPKVPDELALPPGTTPDPRYDGWLSVIDPEKRVGYDFWRARRQGDGTISFQFSKGWTLDGPGFSRPVAEDPIRATGARGSGLPLFAGLISPGELTQGRIDHALAISLPGIARRNFVQPASVTNGIGSRQSLPAGARVRLRGSVGIRNSPREFKGIRSRSVETILTALREYGAIVVDRSSVPTLYAPRGTSNRLVRGNELDWLTVDDFEAIQLPQVFKDPPLAQVVLEGPSESNEGTVQSGQAAGGGQ